MITTPTAMLPKTTLIAAALCAAGLAGCRNEEPAPREEAPATAPSTMTREPPVIRVPTSTSTPAASIIRPEVASDTIVEEAVAPLRVLVAFPTGAALTPEAERQLAGVLQSEALAEGWPVVLRGHSDSDGADAANLATSRRRADAVASWLQDHGVASDRIRVIALGEQNPLAPNANRDGTPNEAGRARNRRVEIMIAPGGQLPAGGEEGSAQEREQSAAERLTAGE